MGGQRVLFLPVEYESTVGLVGQLCPVLGDLLLPNLIPSYCRVLSDW